MLRPIILACASAALLTQPAVRADEPSYEATGRPAWFAGPAEVKVAVEILLVVCPEAFFEMGRYQDSPTLSQAFGSLVPLFNAVRGESAADMPTADLDHEQRRTVFESLVGDRRSCIISVPDFALSSGHAVTTTLAGSDPHFFEEVGIESRRNAQKGPSSGDFEPKLGTVFTVLPVLSADQRTAWLRFEMTRVGRTSARTMTCHVSRTGKNGVREEVVWVGTEDNQPIFNTVHLCRMLQIPVGHSAVMPGWRNARQVREGKEGPPVLSDLPLVGRLFKKEPRYRTEYDTVLVVVTPRLIVFPEQDAAAQPVIRACPADQQPAGEWLSKEVISDVPAR